MTLSQCCADQMPGAVFLDLVVCMCIILYISTYVRVLFINSSSLVVILRFNISCWTHSVLARDAQSVVRVTCLPLILILHHSVVDLGGPKESC